MTCNESVVKYHWKETPVKWDHKQKKQINLRIIKALTFILLLFLKTINPQTALQ